MTRSLARHLVLWILGALSAGAVALVAVSYFVMLDEINEIFNENLKQVALAAATFHRLDAPQRPRTRDQLPTLPPIYEAPGDFDFVTLTWSRDGQLQFSSDPAVALPYKPLSGLSRSRVQGERWHVYTIATAEGALQVAQRATSRRLLAAEAASQLFMPLLVLIALIGIAVVVALRRGLKPLDAAARSVEARSAATLQPISEAGLPREIFPLIRAINGLMQRLSDSLTAQRRFVADASHELRSPLTALRLQVQLLDKARSDERRADSVRELKAGIERAQRLVEQLLDLSRLEPDAAAQRFEAVDLGRLVRDTVAALSPQAQAKGIDLGADTTDGSVLQADRHQLRVMLNNLVGNAIRYTPPGGSIDVRVRRGDAGERLQVIDTGPGIPAAERERVFDRFYRGESRELDAGIPGSGLGLAIVQAVARRHRATVSLHTPAAGTGLEVRVDFPD